MARTTQPYSFDVWTIVSSKTVRDNSLGGWMFTPNESRT